ncbi:MAG: hypothetical protein ACP6KW_02620 [Candidatus Thorarchaeota archaeon]
MGSNDSPVVSHEPVVQLEFESVDIAYDERYLYAACRDHKIRVWSKADWQLVAELGETDTMPLAVAVDDSRVYATCEKRVYVWNKETWGMTGWFELSYQAVTSRLHGDYFYIGAQEGRLVSIQKDTHETNSWQLHKSDITSIWSDDKIICTCTRKEEPRVWLKNPDAAPSELARLDKKGKGGVLGGTNEFVLVGTPAGEIAVFDRGEYSLARTLEPRKSNAIHSLWASNYYVIAANSNGTLSVWDLRRGEELGEISFRGTRNQWVTADHDLVYVATTGDIQIIRLMAGGQPLDVMSEGPSAWKESLLKTSPYDVLEATIRLEKRGDEKYREGLFREAVLEYENALQQLIDNTHALQEVPTERQMLTEELNSKLGRALLKSKIIDIEELSYQIRQLSEELDIRKRTDMAPDDVEKLWSEASRAIKESRVLAEAQAADMLSYQLTAAANKLDHELQDAMERYNAFRETINQAMVLIRGISNEWRWMERKRTSLTERKKFLEGAIGRISEALKAADEDSEVSKILSGALEEYRRLDSQIDRIITSHEEEEVAPFMDKEEVTAAIEGLLSVIPQKRASLSSIENPKQRELERQKILSALQQALQSAESFKLSKQAKAVQAEIEALESLGQQ